MKYKTLSAAIALLSIGLISASAIAQTQNIPVPASAVNGGRAVVAITIPAIPALPPNICTSTNGNCVTSATLPSQVAPLITNQGGSGRSWTSYFVGQKRCDNNNGRTCAGINPDGSVTFYVDNSPWNYTATPVGYSAATGGSCGNLGFVATPILSNSQIRDGSGPTDFVLTSGFYGACNPAEGGTT